MRKRITDANAKMPERLALTVFLVGIVGALLTPSAIAQHVSDPFDWMPAQAVDDASRTLDFGGEQIIPEIIITETPKPTANMADFTEVYVIELEKFKISNKGVNPIATSKGINEALQYAKTLTANRIVFPKGTYLISEADPIVLDHQNTIIDLNGSVLQVNEAESSGSSAVDIIDGAENLRLTNGILRGERDANDSKRARGGCRVLVLHGGKNLEIDHLTISNARGFSISSRSSGSRTRPELLALIMARVTVSDMEQGAFSEQGKRIPSTEKMRTIKPYDATRCKGQFEFGCGGLGYQGYPYIKGRVYQVYFYDKDMKFLEMAKVLQYKKVAVPENANFMHFEINQPALGGEPKTTIARITNFRPPRDVHFHNNHIFNNRALGMAFCGGQRWLMEDNLFEKNGPDIVGWGFDFEDGWELMQHVVLRNNVFKGNLKGDLVICAGTELLFEGNTFAGNVVVHGRPHNYIFRNNRFTGGNVGYKTRTGIAKIHDNTYENCTLSIVFDTKAVADGLYRKPGETVVTPPLTLENETLINVKRISGTYFNFTNSKMTNSHFVAGKETRLINFKNCELDGSSIEYQADGPDVMVNIENCKGSIEEKGPGLKRRKAR